ncbi:hypothetical protein MRX96_045141 [Rhipicephalus microplus]
MILLRFIRVVLKRLVAIFGAAKNEKGAICRFEAEVHSRVVAGQSVGKPKSKLVPPKISPFSFPNNASVGQRGTAICTTTEGDRPLTFRWLKNGRRLEEKDGTVTDNVDFSVLKIESLDVESSGNYTCVVTNLVGSTSRSATLTVHEAIEEREHSGNGTLIFRSTGKSDSGEYKCEASNGIGQPLQKTVTVTIKMPPRVTPFTFAPKLVVGQRATVTCSTYEGSQPLTFVWLKDGALMSKSGTMERTEGEGFSMLNISPLSLEHSGNYTCVVSNAAGSDSTSSSLVVHAPPKWIHAPKDEVVSVGESVTMHCAAAGHPPPTITWSKNDPPKVLPFVIPKNLLVGERISITCSAASGTKPLTFMWIKDDATLHRGSALRITDSSDYSTLSIENLKTSDAGNYTCVVSNSGGTASHSDVLQVKAAPSWTVEPRDVTVTAGETITLNCNGTGFPPPKIGWIREGGAAADVYGGSIIRIASASKKDEADYKCHISNGVGEDLYKSVRVTVKRTRSALIVIAFTYR